jgi:hypothetical protein
MIMGAFIWSVTASLQEMTALFPSKGRVCQLPKSLCRWNRWFCNMMDDVVGSFVPASACHFSALYTYCRWRSSW